MSIATKTRLQAQIQQSREMLDLLDVLSQFDMLFQHFDTQIDQNAYDVAAADVASMERLLHDIRASSSLHVMDMMRTQTRMRQNQLHFALDAKVDAVCAVSPKKLELFPAHDLWPSLEVAHRLSFHLDALASSIHRHILVPILTDANLDPQIHSNTLALLTKPALSTANPAAVPLFAKALQHVLSVFQFIHAHWPDQASLGNVLWNAHAEAPLLALFVQSLPSSLADLAAFKAAVQPVKRERVLVAVRHSMHKDYMDSVVVSTTDHHSTLSSGKKKGSTDAVVHPDQPSELRVSLCASKLWTQVESLLDEASLDNDASKDVSLALFHTARDAIFLFRMGLASLHKEALVQDPRVVMLVHNDCILLTHHMLTCMYRRKSSLPRGVGLIDMVPDVRDFGEHVVMHFAKTQSDKMLASLHTCPVRPDMLDDAAFNQAETCLKVVLFQLQRIAQHWNDGLDVSATVLGRMLRPLLHHLMQSLLHATAAAGPMDKAIHSTHHLFQLWVDATADGSIFASPSVADKHTPNLAKFRLLTQLMVTDSWHEDMMA
ncbi:hypothetical protein DYB32_007139 [Aphanomyces invadans]|uniref:Centromere/kinetochore protein zw10 C-terminal domain-containing protein n=1 Tax=Aphanomyces invadans TaxID=157072 RepID=A0A418APA0_9STRA|nr:hypothetical protein DYB32_007139 [Aphanomyces invadans]